MWWIIGGVVVLALYAFVFGACKVADRADREMGLK